MVKIMFGLFFLTGISLIILGSVFLNDGCDEKSTTCVVLSREGYCQVTYVNTTYNINDFKCLYSGEGCGPGLNNTEIDCYVTLESKNVVGCPQFSCSNEAAVFIFGFGVLVVVMTLVTFILYIGKKPHFFRCDVWN